LTSFNVTHLFEGMIQRSAAAWTACKSCCRTHRDCCSETSRRLADSLVCPASTPEHTAQGRTSTSQTKTRQFKSIYACVTCLC